MKLISWMQSKFSGGHGDKRANALPPTDKKNQEAHKDWPNGLLSIGTLGYKDHVHTDETFETVEQSLDSDIPQGEGCSSPDFSEFTAEEVRSLQKELTKLMRQKSPSKAEETAAGLPLEKFLNCPSSLEGDLDSDNKDGEDIDRTIQIILGRCKDACQKKRAIGKKSLSFFVKKLFSCRSGLTSTPSLRDTLQESRMEKLMRAMLAKKIHPRNSNGALLPNKSIEHDQILNDRNGGALKWDKTDSEFIVLEI